VHAVTLQNEPHFEPKDYPGMRLEPAARARVIAGHLGPALAAAGLRTEVWDWDHNWDQPESPLAVLADPAARRHVRGVAWHCYAGDVSAQSRVRDAHPDVPVYFTECSGGGWAPDFGDALTWQAGTLVVGATRHWARGVALWNLALDERGGPHLGGCGNCRGVVTIHSQTGAVTRNAEYYALAHASRFVRPAAVRVRTEVAGAAPPRAPGDTSPARALGAVAFRNADDGSTALVLVNPAPVARGAVVRVAASDGSRAFRYVVPPRAVATFVWNGPGG
jgi:glucosylceramidase